MRDGWDGRDLLVVAAEGLAVHVEEEVSGCVGAGCDDDLLSRCGIRGGWKWEIRDCFTKVILHSIASAKLQPSHRVQRNVHCRIYYHHKASPS